MRAISTILIGSLTAASLAALAAHVFGRPDAATAQERPLVRATTTPGECRIAFRSPALAASPELLRAAKAELSFELVARPGARLEALLASTTIAGSLLSHGKVSFDSGQAVVDSPLSLASATALRLSQFAFPDAALTLARLETSSEMTIEVGAAFHHFDLWEAPAAVAAFKACVREQRGEPAGGAPPPRRTADTPRPVAPSGDDLDAKPVAPYRAPGVTGDVVSVGNFAHHQACQLIVRNPPEAGPTPFGLGLAVDYTGNLVVALKGLDGRTPQGAPWFTDLDGASVTGGAGGLASAGLRITSGEEAADLLARFERGKTFNVSTPPGMRPPPISMAPVSATRAWLVDCVAKRFSAGGAWVSFLDAAPMRVDAERLGVAWLREAGIRDFDVEATYAGRAHRGAAAEAPVLPGAVRSWGRLSGLTRIVADSDVGRETQRVLDAAAAACPAVRLSPLDESKAGDRRVVATHVMCGENGRDGNVLAIGFSRRDGSSAVLMLAQSDMLAAGLMRRTLEQLRAAIPKLAQR